MARLGEELATLVVDRRPWLLVAQQAVAGLQQGGCSMSIKKDICLRLQAVSAKCFHEYAAPVLHCRTPTPLSIKVNFGRCAMCQISQHTTVVCWCIRRSCSPCTAGGESFPWQVCQGQSDRADSSPAGTKGVHNNIFLESQFS